MKYKKRYIRTIRLNSFWPLCSSIIGLKAIEKFNFAPFIDRSCRREPDLENKFPSITSLCRQYKFAPHLYPNDIIVYTTVKGPWYKRENHYRLVAILEVIERRNSHEQGASWYFSRNLSIPSNCMIPEVLPLEFNKTGGDYKKVNDMRRFLSYSEEKMDAVGKARVKNWDAGYLKESKVNATFIITRPIFIELFDPPILSDAFINNTFGGKINTRMPNIISKVEFSSLAFEAGIEFNPNI